MPGRIQALGSVLRIPSIILGLFGALNAQRAGEKLVDVHDVEQINDAVLISDISVAGKTVECGLFIKPPVVIQPVTAFQADNDWLQHMSISMVNRTNKTIVFGSIIFHFLDTGDCQSVPCAGTTLSFGRIPAVDAYDGRTGRPLKLGSSDRTPLDWNPEQTIIVHVRDHMDEIESDLSDSIPATDINRLNVYRGPFYFADGMKWDLGRYAVPDPERRGKFKELPVDYFPGRRGNNWPPGYRQ